MSTSPASSCALGKRCANPSGAVLYRKFPATPLARIPYGGLGTFMLSAGLVVSMLEYPGSPLHAILPDADLRRALVGLAMGLTAVGIINSP